MKNGKILTVGCLCLLVAGLSGCGTPDPTSGAGTDPIKTRCIDGVEYIFFKGQAGYMGWGYMSVKFNPDSTVATCN